jgi:hypothetical protein
LVGDDVLNGVKVIVLNRESKAKTKLESGNYTLLLEAPKGCEIRVLTRTYKKIRDLSLFQTIED